MKHLLVSLAPKARVALLTFLVAVPVQGLFTALLAQDDLAARGKRTYTNSCSSCHGPDGAGISGIGPTLHGSKIILGNPKAIVQLVLDGLEGPIVAGGETWDDFMPGFRRDRRLNDDAIAAVAKFLRTAWGHQTKGEDLSAEQVAAIRSETASRSATWTVAELTFLDK